VRPVQNPNSEVIKRVIEAARKNVGQPAAPNRGPPIYISLLYPDTQPESDLRFHYGPPVKHAVNLRAQKCGSPGNELDRLWTRRVNKYSNGRGD
jgi:hypothetical protein